jgi:hypothetical protein
MRSTFKTLTFAAIALSLATGGAFAAGRHEHGGSAINTGGHDSEPLTVLQPAPVVIAQTPVYQVPVYRPHLTNVLAGLRSADRTIERDQALHRLSASNARMLEGEASSIRGSAMAVADMHNGAIPNATFQRLKGDIRKLDWDIVRLS